MNPYDSCEMGVKWLLASLSSSPFVLEERRGGAVQGLRPLCRAAGAGALAVGPHRELPHSRAGGRQVQGHGDGADPGAGGQGQGRWQGQQYGAAQGAGQGDVLRSRCRELDSPLFGTGIGCFHPFSCKNRCPTGPRWALESSRVLPRLADGHPELPGEGRGALLGPQEPALDRGYGGGSPLRMADFKAPQLFRPWLTAETCGRAECHGVLKPFG